MELGKANARKYWFCSSYVLFWLKMFLCRYFNISKWNIWDAPSSLKIGLFIYKDCKFCWTKQMLCGSSFLYFIHPKYSEVPNRRAPSLRFFRFSFHPVRNFSCNKRKIRPWWIFFQTCLLLLFHVFSLSQMNFGSQLAFNLIVWDQWKECPGNHTGY